MITKKNRFHGRGGIARVYKTAKTYKSDFFVLRVQDVPRRDYSRFAVVVSKKTHKSAVGRNRMRRRVYEMIRNMSTDSNAHYDMIVIVRTSEVITTSHQEILYSFEKLLDQAGVTRQRS